MAAGPCADCGPAEADHAGEFGCEVEPAPDKQHPRVDDERH
jgi:hypothetical protein